MRKNSTKRIKIFCDNCGKLVAVVTFYPEGENKSNSLPTLKVSGISGWICNSTVYHFNRVALTKEFLLYIAKLLKEEKFRELSQIDYNDTFGFICFKCGKCYCRDCWSNITPIFENGCGWYDYTLATCPAGHKGMIDD